MGRVVNGTVGCRTRRPVLRFETAGAGSGVILSVDSGKVNVPGDSLPHVFRGKFANRGKQAKGGSAKVNLCLYGHLYSGLKVKLATCSRGEKAAVSLVFRVGSFVVKIRN